MRIIVATTLIALELLAAKGHRVTIHISTEDPQAIETTIQLEPIITIIRGDLSQARLRAAKTVTQLHEKGVKPTQPEIARALDLSERTVRQHLAWLRNHGFLEEKRGVYTPTPLLKLYLKLHATE